MKNILMTLVVLSVSMTGFAAEKKAASSAPAKSSGAALRNYGSAGCGLGSMVIDKKGSQIFAATTNATAATQFFGITFGTSNCVDEETAAFSNRMDRFVEVNKVALASDIARGKGETLAALGSFMNCQDGAKLNQALQSNFSRVFPSHEVDTMSITDGIMSVVRENQDLNQTCQTHVTG